MLIVPLLGVVDSVDSSLVTSNKKFYQVLTNNMENLSYMLQGSCLNVVQEVLLSEKKQHEKEQIWKLFNSPHETTFPDSCVTPQKASDCRQQTKLKESNTNLIL